MSGTLRLYQDHLAIDDADNNRVFSVSKTGVITSSGGIPTGVVEVPLSGSKLGFRDNQNTNSELSAPWTGTLFRNGRMRKLVIYTIGSTHTFPANSTLYMDLVTSVDWPALGLSASDIPADTFVTPIQVVDDPGLEIDGVALICPTLFKLGPPMAQNHWEPGLFVGGTAHNGTTSAIQIDYVAAE